jgi:hypothetical protein
MKQRWRLPIIIKQLFKLFNDVAQKARLNALMDKAFTGGDVLYRGYVDDPRNTDNAWMETVCAAYQIVIIF